MDTALTGRQRRGWRPNRTARYFDALVCSLPRAFVDRDVLLTNASWASKETWAVRAGRSSAPLLMGASPHNARPID